MRQPKLALLLAISLCAVIGSFGEASALPPSPANPVQWNNNCHEDGAQGDDALNACCSQYGSQCIAGCAKDDSACKSKCGAVREQCIAIGIVTKGGKTQAKPITPGKPAQAK